MKFKYLAEDLKRRKTTNQYEELQEELRVFGARSSLFLKKIYEVEEQKNRYLMQWTQYVQEFK